MALRVDLVSLTNESTRSQNLADADIRHIIMYGNGINAFFYTTLKHLEHAVNNTIPFLLENFNPIVHNFCHNNLLLVLYFYIFGLLND